MPANDGERKHTQHCKDLDQLELHVNIAADPRSILGDGLESVLFTESINKIFSIIFLRLLLRLPLFVIQSGIFVFFKVFPCRNCFEQLKSSVFCFGWGFLRVTLEKIHQLVIIRV